MKNISKTKDRHGASFASYCLEKVDNKGQRAIKTKECERRNETKWRTRQKNAGVNGIGNCCAEQKKAGGRRPGTSARNKSKSVDDKRKSGSKQNKSPGEGLELVGGTNGSQSEDKRNCGGKQNIATGEGLELVRGTKVSQSEEKGTPAQSKTNPLEKAWN